MSRAAAFTREQLREPFTLVLLLAVPAVFVAAAAAVLADFAQALGGRLAGDSASALAAGWAAALIAGVVGFFQAASSRGADRRLALAGAGAARVAGSRIGASLVLALVASAAGFVALLVRAGVTHPWHAAAAILGVALVYLALGILVGSLISAPLEGSLIVVLAFLLDVFSGPGMAERAAFYSVSRTAAEILIAAGAGMGSPAADWLRLAGTVGAAIALSFGAFVWSARSRA